MDIITADVLDWAATYSGPKFHALLCDPPYHLTEPRPGSNGSGQMWSSRSEGAKQARRGGFMGKSWDGGDIAFRPETWAALAAHLLPGAFIMAFSGARTYHRMACAIEDAGLILHSMIGWVYGSGFPKATRIDTQIDRAAGAEREIIGRKTGRAATPVQDIRGGRYAGGNGVNSAADCSAIYGPATPLASAWAGHRYGLQALKPAMEPICVAQVPYAGRPVDCITSTGAGALWVDGVRIGASLRPAMVRTDTVVGANCMSGKSTGATSSGELTSLGRWPANLALSHTPECRLVGTKRVKSHNPDNATAQAQGKNGIYGAYPGEVPHVGYADADGLETVERWECAPGCPVQALDQQAGNHPTGGPGITKRNNNSPVYSGPASSQDRMTTGYADTGGPSRFFFVAQADAIDEANPFYYCSKASRAERDRGLEGMPLKETRPLGISQWEGQTNGSGKTMGPSRPAHNPHPTVKPIALARWLATLLLPPAEYAPRRILIPFAGSGSECIGAALAGWEEVTGIEREAEYAEIARARAQHWLQQPALLRQEA